VKFPWKDCQYAERRWPAVFLPHGRFSFSMSPIERGGFHPVQILISNFYEVHPVSILDDRSPHLGRQPCRPFPQLRHQPAAPGVLRYFPQTKSPRVWSPEVFPPPCHCISPFLLDPSWTQYSGETCSESSYISTAREAPSPCANSATPPTLVCVSQSTQVTWERLRRNCTAAGAPLFPPH